jgi:hypothetical protein
MSRISPLNVTAQMTYRPRGTPPGGLIGSAVGNYYPGLEIDLRNLWRRIFVGILLHEAVAVVVDVDDDAPDEVKALQDEVLVSVDGKPIWIDVKGPKTSGGPSVVLDQWSLEWSNALADAVQKAGTQLDCRFTKGENATQDVKLTVRKVFEPSETDAALSTALLSRELAQPGELTQSLCSPWQNDFVGCGCYYWAASRPDYINVERDAHGADRGQNWLERGRTASTPIRYTLRPSKLLTHEDLIKSWEDKLTFALKGRDRP